jgi:tRNA pseudouridine32 synthase / 23S rRNA pseudouridine746 synthase
LLEQQLATKLYPAHRLDQDTSGVLLFAKNLVAYYWVAKQFAERHVQKVYQAVLVGNVLADEGVIELPLSADISDRPRQRVDQEFGKPCVTEFRVIDRREDLTWIELRPLTGRTHQLRVHTAIGLGSAILGDRLYGKGESSDRLYLHAQGLTLPAIEVSGILNQRPEIIITSNASIYLYISTIGEMIS